MRVGFAAGDRKFLAAFHELRNVAAPQVPVPLQQVAVAAYSDEAHVEENRRLYRIKFDLADQILGSRFGYVRPAGGFFAWLDLSERGRHEPAALVPWPVRAPSLSGAPSRALRNIVGYPGAIGADLLMQILGLGSIMLILPIAIWGWRMLTHRTFDREALRLGCWILCTVIAAGLARCWPHGGARPLPTGLGRVVGG